eukprot:3356206-Amphidinium_carterae.2
MHSCATSVYCHTKVATAMDHWRHVVSRRMHTCTMFLRMHHPSTTCHPITLVYSDAQRDDKLEQVLSGTNHYFGRFAAAEANVK